jgi:hypothetical protein
MRDFLIYFFYYHDSDIVLVVVLLILVSSLLSFGLENDTNESEKNKLTKHY